MRVSYVISVLAIMAAGCGDHARHSSWRHTLALTVPASASEVSELEYPPFTEGVFPCSRCHGGEGAATSNADTSSFAHALHLEEGLACEDCHMPHGGAEPARAQIEFCQECHEKPAEGSDGVRKYFESIRGPKGDYTIPSRWASDELVAHHPAHAKAEIACEECHGKPVDGPMVKPRVVPLMEQCVACHEQRKVSNTCETCHTGIRDLQHRTILLRHAEDQRDCFGCHNPENLDVLRLANGKTLPFEDSFRLCGQCHGPKLRDWRDGLHGKRTGEWNGKRKYLLCVHCHSPHEPRIKPMAALPRPPRPEEVR
ncbi:MAG: cytochrome c3 family protein [Planctomycetota bacterium]|jgi:predicted CXXCH cytochrome family protein